jgi:Tol biopolymer transport system component
MSRSNPGRQRSRHLGAVLAVLLVVGLAAAGAAESTTRGANGLIVYAEEVRGHLQLFTIRPDGSGAKQLTKASVAADSPDWSPDGRRIVFGLESEDRAGIAVMSADGTGLRILTPRGFQGQPSFSPDGRWIVFERDPAPGDNGVWLMRSDGTDLRRVTRNPFGAGNECGCDTDPNFSPDGRLISFVRVKEEARLQALFVVRRDGTGLRQLTPYSWDVAVKHDWAPDGKRILVTTNADFARRAESANMVTIRPDGTGRIGLTRFTGGRSNAFAGSYSPDGRRIVFRLESGSRFSLAVVDRDGRNLRTLTTGTERPRFIDWGTRR